MRVLLLIAALLLATPAFAGSWTCPGTAETDRMDSTGEVKRVLCRRSTITGVDVRVTYTFDDGDTQAWYEWVCDADAEDIPEDCEENQTIGWDDEMLDDRSWGAAPSTFNCPGGGGWRNCATSLHECEAYINDNDLVDEVFGASGDSVDCEREGEMWRRCMEQVPRPPQCGGLQPLSQCSDGVDNDNDTWIDWDELYGDPQCWSPFDNNESLAQTGGTQCSNGVDDEGDGEWDCELASFNPDSDCDNAPGRSACDDNNERWNGFQD